MTSQPPHVVLATCLAWPALSESDQRYAAALAARGIIVAAVPWNGLLEPFLAADLVVLRSTWDYHHAPHAYTTWLGGLGDRGTPVCNPPDLVAWNLDKRYLLDLKRAGVPIPRTCLVENEATAVMRIFDQLGHDRAVIKPAIGASGHQVELIRRGAIPAVIGGLAGVPAQLIVQEFMPEVQDAGELSCIFFGGEFSHAIVKRPTAGEFRVNSSYSGTVQPAQPAGDLVRQAHAALHAAPPGALYARVDGVVRDGVFVLMELELNEPSLFLQYSPLAADRFAEATVRRLVGVNKLNRRAD